MAKKVKDDAVEKAINRPTMKRLLADITKRKKAASEETSSLGGFMKNQLELHNLNRTAFNWTLKLNGMEAQQRAEVFRCFMEYVHKGDLLAQMELFDDTYKIMEEMRADKKENPPPKPKGDSTVVELARTH